MGPKGPWAIRRKIGADVHLMIEFIACAAGTSHISRIHLSICTCINIEFILSYITAHPDTQSGEFY